MNAIVYHIRYLLITVILGGGGCITDIYTTKSQPKTNEHDNHTQYTDQHTMKSINKHRGNNKQIYDIIPRQNTSA